MLFQIATTNTSEFVKRTCSCMKAVRRRRSRRLVETQQLPLHHLPPVPRATFPRPGTWSLPDLPQTAPFCRRNTQLFDCNDAQSRNL